MTCRYLAEKNLEALYAGGEGLTDIASELGARLAAVYRELPRGGTGELDNNGRCGYSAGLGQKRVSENFKRRGRRAANK